MKHSSGVAMTAGQEVASTQCIWAAPFADYDDERLLEHLQRRKGVHYFAVEDPAQSDDSIIAATLDGVFEFNGERYQLDAPIDWRHNPSTDREWHVMLHKFYFSVGLGRRYVESKDERYLRCWMDAISSWIAQAPADYCANPQLRIECSQVMGRRLQNWVYAYFHFVTMAKVPLPAAFNRAFLKSLHAQTDFLRNHLSSARNHRTLELYAIFLVAVVFPEFERSASWRSESLGLLVQNLVEDLLADGVHCELSTDYHHLVLRNFLCVRRLAEMNGIEVPSVFDERLRAALEFSLHIHKPDGTVPAFSDGDVNDYRELLVLGYELYGDERFIYAATRGRRGKAPQQRTVHFSHGGYVVSRSGWGEHEPFCDELFLTLDCGPLGAGNHGHFDLLSFEAAAFGESLIVDPGRYTYHEKGPVNWRARFRGTAYHNTVLVDDADQTRYGAKAGKERFKVQGPSPEFELAEFAVREKFDFLHGSARSYQYPVVHERRIFFPNASYWVIADRLTASTAHTYSALFHLNRSAYGQAQMRQYGNTRAVLFDTLYLAQPYQPGLSACLDTGFVSPRYGEKYPAPVARFELEAANAVFWTVIRPYRSDARCALLNLLATADSHRSSALSVSWESDKRPCTDVFYFSSARQSLPWRKNDLSFQGSFLWCRLGAGGELLRHETDANGTLRYRTRPVDTVTAH